MIEKEIKEIIALILEDEGITSKNVSENQSLIEDLGFDSVRLMVLATEVESKFDIVMDEGKLENINTVSDVIRHVTEELSK
ncbi:acyl carrier protein [Leuconostoc citreum]|uniref:acyl carrier protein n=1 Tax=Lactobacillales TaxID=186826 RepID=UPI000EEBB70A|nr:MULTISPECIES: acyl carrier protein [Lactobacillales]MCT3054753.1 acyl carrier protein [Leuconostoc citreum]MCT3062959.1 acyl carrier protein [Leuconostoc citreum]MCT3073725.1 acyl carrier protein [Leuconostoc citreum]HCM89195.1 acyl carrier protein [Vagococcus sp.]